MKQSGGFSVAYIDMKGGLCDEHAAPDITYVVCFFQSRQNPGVLYLESLKIVSKTPPQEIENEGTCTRFRVCNEAGRFGVVSFFAADVSSSTSSLQSKSPLRSAFKKLDEPQKTIILLAAAKSVFSLQNAKIRLRQFSEIDADQTKQMEHFFLVEDAVVRYCWMIMSLLKNRGIDASVQFHGDSGLSRDHLYSFYKKKWPRMLASRAADGHVHTNLGRAHSWSSVEEFEPGHIMLGERSSHAHQEYLVLETGYAFNGMSARCNPTLGVIHFPSYSHNRVVAVGKVRDAARPNIGTTPIPINPIMLRAIGTQLQSLGELERFGPNHEVAVVVLDANERPLFWERGRSGRGDFTLPYIRCPWNAHPDKAVEVLSEFVLDCLATIENTTSKTSDDNLFRTFVYDGKQKPSLDQTRRTLAQLSKKYNAEFVEVCYRDVLDDPRATNFAWVECICAVFKTNVEVVRQSRVMHVDQNRLYSTSSNRVQFIEYDNANKDKLYDPHQDLLNSALKK